MSAVAWSIQQVARMAKVTSRTLRHYDDIGLLPPAFVGHNGYRYYEQEQVLRLQEILLLRELGLGLDAIAEVVDREKDQVVALRQHRDRLLAERDRFDRLAQTVTRTITEVERNAGMTTESVAHWFEGFDPEKQEALQAEARKRWGAEAVDAANAEYRAKGQDWMREQGKVWVAALETLIGHIDANRAPDDPAVQETIAGHHRWLQGNWVPNRESYKGLANVYADDPKFRVKFDKTDPRLAEYLRSAMVVYADANLS